MLLDINNIFADIEINEKKLSKIEPGQLIELYTNIYPEKVKGRIQSVVPAVQGKAMVLSARAKLEASENTLLPGMFVTGNITAYEEKGVVVVPIKVLSKDGGNYLVYVLDEKKEIVRQRSITPGYITREECIIREGLKPGEKVVVDSTGPLKEGAKVKVEKE